MSLSEYFFGGGFTENNDFGNDQSTQIIQAEISTVNSILNSLASKTTGLANELLSNIKASNSDLITSLTQESNLLTLRITEIGKKANEATLEKYNHYAGIKSLGYNKANHSLVGDGFRVDYDGNVMIFIDSLLETLDELTNEIQFYNEETESEAINLGNSIKEVSDEFQTEVEDSLKSFDEDITYESNKAINLIVTAGLGLQKDLKASISSYISSAISSFKATGPGDEIETVSESLLDTGVSFVRSIVSAIRSLF